MSGRTIGDCDGEKVVERCKRMLKKLNRDWRMWSVSQLNAWVDQPVYETQELPLKYTDTDEGPEFIGSIGAEDLTGSAQPSDESPQESPLGAPF